MLPIALVQPPPDDAEKAPPYALAAVLDQLWWDADRRGPLLLVAPQRIAGLSPTGESASLDGDRADSFSHLPPALRPPLPPRPGPDGFRLERLADHFHRRIVTIGAVTTLALIDAVDEVAVQAMLDRWNETGTPHDWLRLFGTLTDDQWARLCGDAGLTRADLNARQTALYDSALPAILRFVAPPERLPPVPRPTDDDFAAMVENPATAERFVLHAVPVGQRDRLVLRLRRDLVVHLATGRPKADRPGWLQQLDLVAMNQAERDRTARPSRPARVVVRGSEEVRRWLSPGVPTVSPRRRVVPKPLDVDLAAPGLRTDIPLVDGETCDALVQRIAAAARLPLVLDARYARLRVATRGASAAAGDLLGALCRGLDATVRRVGPVWIVADERVPDALRPNPFHPASRAESEVREASDLLARLTRRGRLSAIARRGGADLPDALWQATERGDAAFTLPISQLPVAYQAMARRLWDAADPATRSVMLPPDRVVATFVGVLELRWPQVEGTAELARYPASMLTPPAPLERIAWPPAAAWRALAVAPPATDAEAKALVDTAVRFGVTHLFVDGEPVEGLTRLAERTKAADIRLVATLAPLHGGDGARDISLAGDTARAWAARTRASADAYGNALAARLAVADYIRPEAVDVAAVARRVRALSSVPGVFAVGLRDLEPPGYGSGSGGRFAWEGGGDLESRVACLRAVHVDPADRYDGVERSVTAFGQSGLSLSAVLTKLQRSRIEALLTRLDPVRRSLAIPVLVQTGSAQTGFVWMGGTGSLAERQWDAEAQIPASRRNAPLVRSIDPLEFLALRRGELREEMPVVWSEPERLAALMRSVLDRSLKGFDGMVVELSHLPLADALKTLADVLTERR